MKLLHKVVISVFIKPEHYQFDPDIESKIILTIKRLCSIDIDKEKIPIIDQTVLGFNDRKIKTLTLMLEKETHTSTFLKDLVNHLSSAQIRFLLDEKESRVDDNLDFFLRLDLNAMLEEEYKITTSGNCFHIRMVIAAFPKTRESALDVVDRIFARKARV